jgi:hypothetical protein
MAFREFGAAAAVAATLAFSASPAHAATEIQWWHAMTGANNDVIVKLANDFNASQSDYKVVPTYKGGYADTMNAGIAAFRAGNAPHIMQVFEVGTATMMAATGAIKPVYRLMQESGEKFDPKSYLPAITGYYSTSKGEMLSFPFNSSSTVMWINLDAFKKANITDIPKTWPEVFEDAKKLKAAGYTTCGFSNSWVTWVNLEQLSAWHNVPLASKANGLDGFDTVLQFNGPLQVKHLETLVELQKDKTYDYGRRPLHLGRVPDLPDIVRVLRQRQGASQVQLHQRADAVLSGCQRRATELDHWRRFAVGDGWQDARGIQRCCQIPDIPLGRRPPDLDPQGVGLSAHHQGCLREGEGRRLLQGPALSRNAAEGIDQQGADREFPGPEVRQHGATA